MPRDEEYKICIANEKSLQNNTRPEVLSLTARNAPGVSASQAPVKAILTVNLYKRDGELFLRGIEAAGVNLHGEKMNKR